MTWWHVLAFCVGVVIGAVVASAYLWLWTAGAEECVGE